MPAPAPKLVKSLVFRITDIPDVMQFRRGWLVSAQLMRKWFSSPPHQINQEIKLGRLAPPPSIVEDRMVKMAWAFQFSRVRNAYLDLMSGWETSQGLALFRKRIEDTRPRSNVDKPWRFGDLSKPAIVVDRTCQVNIKEVGNLSDPLDDFYGAIGKGLLKVAVTGMVTQLKNGRFRIEIDEIGTYLRDTYDFNDDKSSIISQPLGYWGFNGVKSTPQMRWDIAINEEFVEEESGDTTSRDRLYAVQNDDFRAYRQKHGRGGDFVIYSDVHRVRQAQPKILEL